MEEFTRFYINDVSGNSIGIYRYNYKINHTLNDLKLYIRLLIYQHNNNSNIFKNGLDIIQDTIKINDTELYKFTPIFVEVAKPYLTLVLNPIRENDVNEIFISLCNSFYKLDLNLLEEKNLFIDVMKSNFNSEIFKNNIITIYYDFSTSANYCKDSECYNKTKIYKEDNKLKLKLISLLKYLPECFDDFNSEIKFSNLCALEFTNYGLIFMDNLVNNFERNVDKNQILYYEHSLINLCDFVGNLYKFTIIDNSILMMRIYNLILNSQFISQFIIVNCGCVFLNNIFELYIDTELNEDFKSIIKLLINHLKNYKAKITLNQNLSTLSLLNVTLDRFNF